MDHPHRTFAIQTQRPWWNVKENQTSLLWKTEFAQRTSLKGRFSREVGHSPYCLCWLTAVLSPSCSWVRARFKDDMFLPRRRGWIFSLLSSQSTSPPSAIVKTRCYLAARYTDITMYYLQSNLYSLYFSFSHAHQWYFFYNLEVYCNRPLNRKHIMTNKSIKDLLCGCIAKNTCRQIK